MPLPPTPSPRSAGRPPGDGPGYGATVAALAVGQVLGWAVLYYAFSALVLAMRQSTGWTEQALMGAFTLGLATWGIASYTVGAAIDTGRGRGVMTLGAVLGGVGCIAWAEVQSAWQLYPVFGLLGVAMAMTLYEPAFAVLTKRYPTRYRDGITALTLTAARGLERYGVRANAIAPRARTAMTADVFGAAPGEGEVDPLSPEHVVKLVRFLSSPASENVNGQLFIVYGPTVTLVAAPTVESHFTASSAEWDMTQLSSTLRGYFADRDPERNFSATALMESRG